LRQAATERPHQTGQRWQGARHDALPDSHHPPREPSGLVTTGFHAQPAPASWVAATSFVIAILAIWPRRAWRATRHVVTVAHEGGHALVGLLVGRRLAGIRLHSDASGLTITSGRRDGLGIVATVAVGYPSPSLLGLGAAWLLANHYSHLVLLLSLVLRMGRALRCGDGGDQRPWRSLADPDDTLSMAAGKHVH
jgi:hypothetical protein